MLNVQQGKQDQHLPCLCSKPREGSGGAHSPCQRCYHAVLQTFLLGHFKTFSSQQAYLEAQEILGYDPQCGKQRAWHLCYCATGASSLLALQPAASLAACKVHLPAPEKQWC